MPMHRSGPETQQDLIRFKNLIREAEERLITRGIPAPEAKGVAGIEPKFFKAIFGNRRQSDGLAMFLSPEISHLHAPVRF